MKIENVEKIERDTGRLYHPMEAGECLNRLVFIIGEYKKDPANNYPCLLYAALELRYAIEGTLKDYLLAVYDFELPKKLEKIWRLRYLKKEILKNEPAFEQLCEISIECALSHGIIEGNPKAPDLEYMINFNDRLNNHIHAPMRPQKRESGKIADWWQSLDSLVAEGSEYMFELHAYPHSYMKDLPEFTQGLVDQYVSGEVSIGDIRKIFDEHVKRFTGRDTTG